MERIKEYITLILINGKDQGINYLAVDQWKGSRNKLPCQRLRTDQGSYLLAHLKPNYRWNHWIFSASSPQSATEEK